MLISPGTFSGQELAPDIPLSLGPVAKVSQGLFPPPFSIRVLSYFLYGYCIQPREVSTGVAVDDACAALFLLIYDRGSRMSSPGSDIPDERTDCGEVEFRFSIQHAVFGAIHLK